MILEFPTKDDFYSAANGFLNSSWDSVTEHLHEFEKLHGFVDDSEDQEDSKLYWASAKQTLVNATALVQQAVEFYIKGRIVEVSPYLLISGNPQSWPRGCNKQDIEFSAFRTLDAQDLIKVHDTVCHERFSDEFIQWNEALRTIRNKVMHTVDRTLNVTPEQLINFILFAHGYFNRSTNWFDARRAYLENTPVNSMKSIRSDSDYESYILNSLLIDFRLAIDVLPPAVCKKYFGYDKKARNQHCPHCVSTVSRMDFWDFELIDDLGKTYQKTADPCFYSCNLCGYKGEVVEKQCEELGCEGQLQDRESGVCFSCFFENAL
ncbi:hypothetical protein OPW32_07480 [Vibrio europaeus]|uniref:hypothetical protein n=1 Tax=Vibrio europaeus TaxID=300876 RepID=UPI002341B9D2|nr:hypothetical protein [Vibrio europaeus]MDC5849051.1 hypothetical protein [Vibrio europaeus]